MNRIMVIWLGGLTAVCGWLTYTQWKEKKRCQIGWVQDSTAQAAVILYIDTDSVLSGYTLAEDKRKFLEERNTSRERQLRTKQAAYEAAVQKYQKELPLMTQREQAKAEENLMKMQQELLELQQRFQQEALAEEQALVLMLADTLEGFMSEYAKNRKVDFILGYQRNGSIFYKNPRLDITAEVVERLNQRYKP
ncbi:MAG: OmpH family outer membrane protein [Flavobacteriales bacterium]|nr:OmpH family outer membrane protein [Flavobacteriales bacterium]MCX7769049.1 OmpH family outer membrane protein [Flavobacteriales bacterium]MDW8410323.1 OmpH family outer membrane protein [Flavobacteriales bacterium]